LTFGVTVPRRYIFLNQPADKGVGEKTMLRILPSYVVAVIEDSFPWARTTNAPSFVEPADVPKVASILALVERIPEAILRCSGAGYLSLVQIVPALEHVVNFYASGPPRQIVWPFVTGNNAITTLWLVLTGCPDDAASESTPELRFIENQMLRESIRLDLSASESALNNGEWKAATILAGAVVEALLLWAVDRHPESERGLALQNARQHGANMRKVNAATPDEWHLPELIEAGFELGEITTPSAAQARVAKDFRNLIHPGKTMRENVRCDRGTAHAAFAAAQLVGRDLGARAIVR